MKTRNAVILIILLSTVIFSFLFFFVFTPSFTLKEETKNIDKGIPPQSFTKEMLERANNAFSNGIEIADPQKDWRKIPEGSMQWDKPDNSYPYDFPFTDLKSVSIGADEEFLFFKYQFWGEFPDSATEYHGDMIKSVGVNAALFVNSSEPNYASLATDVAYSFGDDIPALKKAQVGQLAMITPMGLDEHKETIFENMTGEGYVGGGASKDYILSAFPLKLIGLRKGDTIELDFAVESGSRKFHHESIDLLLDVDNSKFGQRIVYNLGSNKYSNYTIEELKKP